MIKYDNFKRHILNMQIISSAREQRKRRGHEPTMVALFWEPSREFPGGSSGAIRGDVTFLV